MCPLISARFARILTRLVRSRTILCPGNRPGVLHGLSTARCALPLGAAAILLVSLIHPARAEATGRTISPLRVRISGLRVPSITAAVGGVIGWNGCSLAPVNRSCLHRWVTKHIHLSLLH